MSQNFKILYISHSSEIGGASRSLLYMAENFKNQCLVLLPKNGPINNLYFEAGIKFRIIRVPALFYSQYTKLSFESIGSFLFHINGLFKLIIHIKNRNYRIVHFNEIVFAPIAAVIKRIFGNKLKIVIHSRIELPTGRKGFFKRLFKRWMKNLDFGIAIGEAEKESLPKQLPQKILINPVSLGDYIPLNKKTMYLHEKYKISSNKTIVGLLGVIHNGKGQERLINALIEENIPETVFFIIGSGPLQKKLEKLSTKLENVIFTGKVECPYLYIEACDYIIRLEENGLLGRDVLEANILGVPILAYVRNKKMYESIVKEDINSALISGLSNKEIIEGIKMMNLKHSYLRNNSVRLNYGYINNATYKNEIMLIYDSLIKDKENN